MNVSIYDTGKFEQKEIMKKRPLAKNTGCDWLINYIPKPLRNGWWC